MGHSQGGTSISGGREGLGPHIKLGGKLWGKVQPNSPNKRKNLGISVTIRHKSWGKIPLLGSSESQRAKFGAPTKISEANFGAKPPQPVNMKVPLGVIHDSAGPKWWV